MKMYKAIPSFFAKAKKVSIILDDMSEGSIDNEIRFLGYFIALSLRREHSNS